MKDPYFEKVTEQSNEVQRQYPQARSHALHTFRNKQATDLDFKQKAFHHVPSLTNTILPTNGKGNNGNNSRMVVSGDISQTEMIALSTITG